MQITRMTAKGLLGLKLTDVKIPAGGGVIDVHGKNGAGKSSFLNIIAMTMGSPKMRNHIQEARGDDQTKAECSVELDNGLTVTRKWNKKGKTTLEIFSEEGKTMIEKPADFLKRIVGEVSLDPTVFDNMQPKAQKAYLLELAGLGDRLEEFDAKKTKLLASKKSAKESLAIKEGIYDALVKPDKSKIMKGPAGAIDIESNQADMDSMEGDIRACQGKIDKLEGGIERNNEASIDFKERIKNLSDANVQYKKDLKEAQKELSAYPSMETMRDNIEKDRAHNEQIALADNDKLLKREVIELENTYEKVIEDIENVEDKRQVALEQAKFPVKGLGFDDEGITFNGIPYSQIAQSERLRINIRIAIATSPDLKVIRVTDASLLDSDSVAEMDKFAKEEGYQFFFEMVDGDGGIMIEEGEVTSVNL